MVDASELIQASAASTEAGNVSTDAQAAPAPPAEPRAWAVRALWGAWLRPAETARRTLHVSLLSAFGIHVIATVGFFVGMFGWIALLEYQDAQEILEEFIDGVVHEWDTTIMTVGISFFVMEAGAFILALILTAWGAIEEPFRKSFRFALVRVWMQTPHIALGLFLAFCYFTLSQSCKWDWRANPLLRALGEQGEKTSLLWAVGMGTWVLYGLLRACGVRVLAAPPSPTPTCQECGYNLTGTSPDGLCPECGESVHASLNSDSRPGVPWEDPPRRDLLAAWWRTTVLAVLHPRELGRQLRVYTPVRSHRSFADLHAVIAFVLMYVSICEGFDIVCFYYRSWEALYLYITPFFAWAACCSLLLTTSLMAGVVGVWYGWGQGRNLMPVAIRVACYLSPMLLLWFVINAALVFTYMAWMEAGSISYLLSYDLDDLLWFAMVLANLWMGLIHLILLARGVRAARYATR